MNTAESSTFTAKPPAPKFLDLGLQFESLRDELFAAISAVMTSQQFILGPEVGRFEQELADYIGCRFAIGCASGSDALLLVLMALGVTPGDEVITTPFTFVATAGAIARLGAKTVFVDIEPLTFNIDSDKIQRAVTRRTRAIIPVHLFGLPAAMDPILDIASQHGIPVIEDAAQAIGAAYRGRRTGTLGTAGCFSFFPSKNLGGAGDGGMVTTNQPELAERIRLLRTHGSRRKYQYELLGMNSRLDTLQAAILRVKLPHLERWNAARRERAERYRTLLAKVGVNGRMTLPLEPVGSHHVYNQFTLRVADREAFCEHLHRMGISTEIYYPKPLHLQATFQNLGYAKGDFPVAERTAEEVVSLPIYPELSDGQQQAIAGAIVDFFARHQLRA